MTSPLTFDIDDATVADYLAFAESDNLAYVDAFEERVIADLLTDDTELGDPMPWSKTSGLFRFRPGEITIWCGINGHKKSMVSGQAMLHLLPYSNVMIASMEMKPEKTINRLLKQANGETPTVDYAKNWISWAKRRLAIYDQLDFVKTDRVLAAVHYAATQMGAKHCLIDSMMKCVSGQDDYNAQKDFIGKLTQLAKVHDIHIHLVHHIRKGRSEEEIPDKFDVKGAGDITDQTDNLIIVHTNKRKVRILEESTDQDEIMQAKKMRDLTLRVAKQRHGEFEGDIKLWFHPQSLQHTGESARGAMPWPNPSTTLEDML